MNVGTVSKGQGDTGQETRIASRGAGIPEPMARLAGGIAHDFNNLLTVINGYGDLILNGALHDGNLAEYAREVLRAGSKASEIVNSILAYTGRQVFSAEVIDVNRLVEGMRGFMELYLGDAVCLTLRLCPDPGSVLGDRGQLQWALLNIVMNAHEAMPQGGEIEISTRWVRNPDADLPCGGAADAHFEIRIRDTGKGMTGEELKHAFEPYFSTKKSANTTGAGLGLACTQGIVRQFGGSIHAESEPGSGSVFSILLPVVGRH